MQAQEETMGNGMLFEDFESGVVFLKNNSKVTTKLNYDLVDERILYLGEGEQVMELVTEGVVLITVGDRRFLPAVKSAFYEELPCEKYSLYLRHQVKILSEGKATAYGGRSSTASIDNVSTIGGGTSGRVFHLKNDEKFKEKHEYNYYLKTGRKFERINSAKALGKLFKHHQKEIEAFAKDNNIHFSKIDDIKKIIDYAYSTENN
jgi:hypothetical protein